MREPVDASNPPHSARIVRIRTDDWPERDRAAMFRDIHGRDRVRVDPLPGEPLRIDATVARFANLALLWGRRSALRSEFAGGNDRLILSLGAPAVATQFGRELELERGDAVALCGSDRAAVTTLRSGRIATLEFPNGALVPLLQDARRSCARRIPRRSPALALLRSYVREARPEAWIGAPQLEPLAIAHIYDLAAIALGATRQAEEIANARGVRAARLRAIKDDILTRLERGRSVGDVAARHRLSSRYVRMLFESEGTSLTEFVREHRLVRARSMLLSPRFTTWRIAEIAYEAGFTDLSYFNRAFRRRFGRTPGECRAML